MMQAKMRDAASMADSTPFARRYLIIATLVCAFLVLVLYLLVHSQPVTALDGEGTEAVVVPLPASGAEVGEYRRLAHETCATARNDWLSLAQLRGTRAWPDDIARGYARYAREPAVYEACLQGLKGKR
jgi:hypothetical protein